MGLAAYLCPKIVNTGVGNGFARVTPGLQTAVGNLSHRQCLWSRNVITPVHGSTLDGRHHPCLRCRQRTWATSEQEMTARKRDEGTSALVEVA